MSTTLVKPAEVERKWYLLDATGKSLGHVAAEAAVLLRGKQKVDYTPNVDCGDFVVVINCDKAVLTGKKAEQKFHITHSKYIGGLKKVQHPLQRLLSPALSHTYFQQNTGPAARPPHTASHPLSGTAGHAPEPGTKPYEARWIVPGFPGSQTLHHAFLPAWYTGKNQTPHPRSFLLFHSRWKESVPAPLFQE